MGSFCCYCGKPLADGATCSCRRQTSGFNAESAKNYVESAKGYVESAKSFVESMKNQMGVGDPELNKGDAFEKDKLIIPDCVNANEGEIPVKQYNVATLRNRICGITYTKAIGRMQVTNKRVIFRAPGRCLAGRTTLQHEFAIDELAGIEARREYVFNIWDLYGGMLAAFIGGGLVMALITKLCSSAIRDGETAGAIILTLLFGVAGCIPFFKCKKKLGLKLLCLGASCWPMISIGGTVSQYGQYNDSGASEFLGGLLMLLGLVPLLLLSITLFIYSIKPNLVLIVKTKSASEAIDIRRKKLAFLFSKEEEHTGYTEVIPEEDAERCIREINAMINDIQKLGDFGIQKWKA